MSIWGFYNPEKQEEDLEVSIVAAVFTSMMLSFSTKVEQVNLMWQEALNNTAYKGNLDYRKKHSKEWAEELVKWVEYYQENEVKRIGGSLPKDNMAHLIAASMAVHETHLRPRAVGSRGEVGILQIHGVALKGHSKREVRNNPKLGIKLGVRWFAHSYSIANKEKLSNFHYYGLAVTSYMTGRDLKRVIWPAFKRILLAEEYYLMYLFGFESF